MLDMLGLRLFGQGARDNTFTFDDHRQVTSPGGGVEFERRHRTRSQPAEGLASLSGESTPPLQQGDQRPKPQVSGPAGGGYWRHQVVAAPLVQDRAHGIPGNKIATIGSWDTNTIIATPVELPVSPTKYFVSRKITECEAHHISAPSSPRRCSSTSRAATTSRRSYGSHERTCELWPSA